MHKPKLIISFLLIFALASCATPYQKDSSLNLVVGGYSDYQVDENTFSVSFRGGNQTPKHLVENSLLLRCAEVTVNNGFDYFIVTSSGSDTKTGAAVIPRETTTTSSATAVTSGNVTVANGYSHSYTLSPQVITWREYTATVTIITFKGNHKDSQGSYDAHQVIKYLSPQLKGK